MRFEAAARRMIPFAATPFYDGESVQRGAYVRFKILFGKPKSLAVVAQKGTVERC
jgi:hypothetical protein